MPSKYSTEEIEQHNQSIRKHCASLGLLKEEQPYVQELQRQLNALQKERIKDKEKLLDKQKEIEQLQTQYDELNTIFKDQSKVVAVFEEDLIQQEKELEQLREIAKLARLFEYHLEKDRLSGYTGHRNAFLKAYSVWDSDPDYGF